MRSKSSRVVKQYSRPFSSDPRGGRVVHEIEKSTSFTCLRNSLTSVLLPEPDGAKIMNKIPATYLSSPESCLVLPKLQPLATSKQFVDQKHKKNKKQTTKTALH